MTAVDTNRYVIPVIIETKKSAFELFNIIYATKRDFLKLITLSTLYLNVLFF